MLHVIVAIYAYRAYTQPMSIEFDPLKDEANRQKHGISLTEGDGVLNDPLALTFEDERVEGEQRFVSLGMNIFDRLMVVVWTPRGTNYRIISVRKAEPKERRNYEEGI